MESIGSSYINIEQNATIFMYNTVNPLESLGINLPEGSPHGVVLQQEKNSEKETYVYQNSCVIIENNGSKYVISTRKKIIFCEKIELYYCKFNKLIYKNELCILFQSIETDIIILGTIGCNELRLDLSELIKGSEINSNIIYSIPIESNSDVLNSHLALIRKSDISSIIVSDKFIIPKYKKKYYASMIVVDPTTEKYIQSVFQFEYIKPFINTHPYLPQIYMFEFELSKKKYILDETFKNHFKDLSGTFIFDHKKKSIGLVIEITLDMHCIVLPIRHVHKIINIFFDGIGCINPSNDNTYSDRQSLVDINNSKSLCLPIEYYVKKNKKKTYDMVVKFPYITSTIELKSNDKIITIDNKEIIMKETNPTIYDDKYDDYLPFNVYLRLNLNLHSMMNITVKRKNKIISYDFYGESIENHMLKLTDQSDFFYEKTNFKYGSESNFIPFINLGGLIIVQFTHELIDMFARNKIKLNSYVIDDFMETLFDNKKISCLLIINDVSKKKKMLSNETILSKLSNAIPVVTMTYSHEYNIINCFVLSKINNINVNILQELNQVVKKKNQLLGSLSTSMDTYEFDIKLK